MSAPFLSIIIPAYNEESRLPDTLEQILRFQQSQPYEIDVWVIENGSRDRTFEIAQSFANAHPGFHVVHADQSGKGWAVRRGMLTASGAYRFMCDADLSMPIDEVTRFLPPFIPAPVISIGSREAEGAIRYNEPPYRHIGGRLVNWLIRLFALPGLQDTQCGFKCFRADVAEDLFNCQTLPGWSFDIEILYIARLRGYPIQEIPIHWFFNPESKLNAVSDAIQMGLDILKIRFKHLRGLYNRRSHPAAGGPPRAQA